MLKSSYQPFFCKKPIPSGIYVSIIKFLLLYLVVTSTLSWKSFIFLFLRCTMSYIKIRCIISIIKLIIIMLFDRSIICFLTGGCSSVGLRGLWLIGWAMVVWRGGGINQKTRTWHASSCNVFQHISLASLVFIA